MSNQNFTELLLHTAVCAIASDGVVDQREIDALIHIEKSSPYFSADDLSSKLEELIKDCMIDYQVFRDKLFKTLDNANLNILEELTLLEISFRIISADEIEEDAEKKFINNLCDHLNVDSHIINQRFGEIDYLESNDSEFKKFDQINQVNINEIKKS